MFQLEDEVYPGEKCIDILPIIVDERCFKEDIRIGRQSNLEEIDERCSNDERKDGI